MSTFRLALASATLLLSLAAAHAQTKPQPAPCPDLAKPGLTGEKNSSGYEPQQKQPQEKSAILPSAGQNETSAAPTVQQGQTPINSQTQTPCERDPNKPRD